MKARAIAWNGTRIYRETREQPDGEGRAECASCRRIYWKHRMPERCRCGAPLTHNESQGQCNPPVPISET